MEQDLRTEAFAGHTPGPWQLTGTEALAAADVRLIAAAPALLADRDRWRKVAEGYFGILNRFKMIAGCYAYRPDGSTNKEAEATFRAILAALESFGTPSPATADPADVKPGWWWLKFRGHGWRVVRVLDASEYQEPGDNEPGALSYALEHGEWQGPILPPAKGGR
jgi:hypothetical protein